MFAQEQICNLVCICLPSGKLHWTEEYFRRLTCFDQLTALVSSELRRHSNGTVWSRFSTSKKAQISSISTVKLSIGGSRGPNTGPTDAASLSVERKEKVNKFELWFQNCLKKPAIYVYGLKSWGIILCALRLSSLNKHCLPMLASGTVIFNWQPLVAIFHHWPRLVLIGIDELPHDKTNKMACAPSEDSYLPVFAVCMKKAWVLSYALNTQWRLWSDWVDDQADLSRRWAQSFCWFCQEVAQMLEPDESNLSTCYSEPKWNNWICLLY